MVKITFSDDFGKSIDLLLDDSSLKMISRFLHFVSFSNPHLHFSSHLQMDDSEFYDSDYSESNIQDTKMFYNCIDYVLGNLS